MKRLFSNTATPTNTIACGGGARFVKSWCVLALLAATSCALVGCEKPLFGPDEPRSQFDRFDAVRDRHVPPYTTDEFGRRRPNIRARLITRE